MNAKEETQKRKITLAATGDILLHQRLLRSAKKIKGYDFNAKIATAKPLLEKADITIANQESIIGGEEIGLSSFPNFNSPVDIGYSLKEHGVDIINLANNHVLDKGEKGLLKSIENWQEIGIPYVGAYKSYEDQEELRVLNKNGLRVCFLSYTRGTNDHKVPEDKPFLVNKFQPSKLKKIKDHIKKVRRENLADVIIVSLHFTKEYHLHPTSEQKEVPAWLSDAGADIIIGHGPHVLHPPEWILNSKGRWTFVAYSLGNFYTGQKGLYRQIGGVLTIDIEKHDSNTSNIKIDNASIKLTYVDSTDKKDYKVRLFEDVVNKKDYIKTDVGYFDSKDTYAELINRMKQWIPKLDIK